MTDLREKIAAALAYQRRIDLGDDERFGDDGVEFDRRALVLVAAAKGENLADEVAGALAGTGNGIDKGSRFMAGLEREQRELGRAHQAGQDVVEIMRDAAGKLADKFHFLGLEELRFDPFLLGQVEHVDDQADR